MLTNKCNLRCKFCYLEDYQGKELELDEINQVLDIIQDKEFTQVSLLGGEPTECEYFEYIIIQLEKLRISYSFSTNGQKLFRNEELIRILSKSKYLKEVQISLESPQKLINDAVRGKGTFSFTNSATLFIALSNVPTRLAMVVTKENNSTIQQMIDMCATLGCRELRLMPFMPMGTGLLEKERLFMDYEGLVRACSDLKIPDNLIVTTYLKEENTAETLGCGAGTTACVINSDLTLSACPVVSQTQKSIEKLGNDGSSFDYIWGTSSIFNIWRAGKYRKSTSCNLCPLFEECGGVPMTQFFNGQKILFINRILFDDAFITVVEVIFFSVYLKLSFSDFSSIMGLCLLISLLVQIPTGYLSDKFDRKLMLVLGNGAEIVCLITLLFLPSLIKGSLFIPVLIIEIIRTGMLALASGIFEVLIFNMFKREGKTEKDFMEKSASYFSIGAIIAAISGFVSTVLFSYLVILPLILDLSIKIIKLLSAIFMCSEAIHKEMTKIKMKVKSLNHKLLFLLFSLALLFCISRGTFSLYQPVMTSLGIPLYYYGLLIMIVNLSIFVLLRVLKKKVSLFKLSTLLLVSFAVLTFQGVLVIEHFIPGNLFRFLIVAIIFSSMQIIRLFSEGLSSYFINTAIKDRDDKTTIFSLYSTMAQLLLSASFFLMGVVQGGVDNYLMTYLYISAIFVLIIMALGIFGKGKKYV
ncbi:radical SAM protein [Lactococcus lactis]